MKSNKRHQSNVTVGVLIDLKPTNQPASQHFDNEPGIRNCVCGFFRLFSQWSIVNIVWVDVLDWFGLVFGTKSGKKIESRSKYNDQAQAQQLNQYRQSLCRSIVSSLLLFFQFVLMQFIYGILCCTFSSDVDING